MLAALRTQQGRVLLDFELVALQHQQGAPKPSRAFGGCGSMVVHSARRAAAKPERPLLALGVEAQVEVDERLVTLGLWVEGLAALLLCWLAASTAGRLSQGDTAGR